MGSSCAKIAFTCCKRSGRSLVHVDGSLRLIPTLASARHAAARIAAASFRVVAALLKTFRRDDVVAGIKEAMARGAIGFDAVKHLVRRIERRPPRLDLTVYPYLPRATVATTSAKTYMDLLTGVAS